MKSIAAMGISQTHAERKVVCATKSCDTEKPDVGQYWEICNDSASCMSSRMIHILFLFFELTAFVYRQTDLKFEVLSEDFVQRLEEPQLMSIGR